MGKVARESSEWLFQLEMPHLFSSHGFSGPTCSSKHKEADWPVVCPWSARMCGAGCLRLVGVKRGGVIHWQRVGDSRGMLYPYHISLALRLPYDLQLFCWFRGPLYRAKDKGRGAILCIQNETVASICGYLFGEQGMSTCSLLYSQSLAQ